MTSCRRLVHVAHTVATPNSPIFYDSSMKFSCVHIWHWEDNLTAIELFLVLCSWTPRRIFNGSLGYMACKPMTPRREAQWSICKFVLLVGNLYPYNSGVWSHVGAPLACRSIGGRSMPSALCGFMCGYCGFYRRSSLSRILLCAAAAAEKSGFISRSLSPSLVAPSLLVLLSPGESSLMFRSNSVGYTPECGDLLSEIFEYDQIWQSWDGENLRELQHSRLGLKCINRRAFPSPERDSQTLTILSQTYYT